MASRETLKLFQLTNIGYYLKCTPFLFITDIHDKIYILKTISVTKNKKDKYLWYLMSMLHISIRIFCIILPPIWYELMYSNKASLVEKVQVGFGVILSIVSIFIQLCNIILEPKIEVVASGFYLYCRKLVEWLKINQKLSDGCERPLKLFLWTAGAISVCTFPTIFIIAYLGLHVHSLFGGGSLFKSFLTVCVLSFCYITDWIFIYLYVAAAVIYVTLAGRRLRECSWKPGLTSKQKYHRLILYRSGTMLHKFIMDEVKASLFILAAIFVSAILLIGVSSGLICFWEHLNSYFIIILISLLLIAFITTEKLLILSNAMIDGSLDFCKSYAINNLSKYEQTSFKSCVPIKIPIGPISMITKQTFPYFISDIVISYIIDLVLTYNKTNH